MATLETLSAMNQSLVGLAAQAEITTEKMTGMIDPLLLMRASISDIGTESETTADKLRKMGAIGLKAGGGEASSGGMATPNLDATGMENLARSLKPYLDKILARSK